MRVVSRSGLIATALAVGAIAVPNATAGQSAQASRPSPLAGPLALQQSPAPTPRPAPASSLWPWAGPLALQPGGQGSITPRPTILPATPPSTGFDYGDAAVGAGVMAGLTIVVTAGALTIRRRGLVRHG